MRDRELVAAFLAALAAGLLVLLIYVGSEQFKNFDSALIGYAVATVMALGGLVYRYVLWVQKPPTWRYFKGGWTNFLSWRNFRRYFTLVPRAWWTDVIAQTFIARRGLRRWIAHMSIFWGTVLSLAIVLPLTFGWFRFTLDPPNDYRLWFFGVSVGTFPLDTVISFIVFHGLDITAVILLAGLALAFWRRTSEGGLLAIQRFSFDLMPVVLLAAVAITGLLLTASYAFWDGRYYSFLSLTHQLIVVIWLLSLPFGKFFHIIERPATIGVRLYQQVSQDVEHFGRREPSGSCRRCRQPLPSAQFVEDLKGTLSDLSQEYDMGAELGDLMEYCPTCKRALRGQAYYQLMGKRFL